MKTKDIDIEILHKSQTGCRKSIRILYEHCFGILIPVCLRYHNNDEDARSSFNLGFIKILDAMKKLDVENLNFGAWSKKIIVNTLIDEYRRNTKINQRELRKETEAEIDYHANSHENLADSNLGVETLMKLIKQLPEMTKKVFNLSVMDGYSHKEIAEQLDLSEGTSKWHLSNARKILKEKIENIEKMNEKLVI